MMMTMPGMIVLGKVIVILFRSKKLEGLSAKGVGIVLKKCFPSLNVCVNHLGSH